MAVRGAPEQLAVQEPACRYAVKEPVCSGLSKDHQNSHDFDIVRDECDLHYIAWLKTLALGAGTRMRS